MKKSAFTLIETLLATLIAVVILGSAVLASRTTQIAALERDQMSQMQSLAEDSVGLLQYFKDVPKLGYDFETESGFLPGLNEVNGAFVMTDSYGTCESGAGVGCPEVNIGGPISLKWCHESAGACWSASGQVCDMVGNCSMQTNGIELVAVRREVEGGTWLVRSLSDISNTSTVLDVNNLEDKKEWNFYSRQIVIKRASDIVFNNSQNESQLQDSSYYASVVITDLNNESRKVVRNIFLNDF